MKLIFASEQFEARQLPAQQRRDRYRHALGDLQAFSRSLEAAAKADPKDRALESSARHLNEDIALAALESGELDLAKTLAEGLRRETPTRGRGTMET